MKKALFILLTCCCLFSERVFAEEDCIGSPDECYDYLIVSLYNNTAYECTLTSQSEIHGRVYHKRLKYLQNDTQVPSKLYPGAYASFIVAAPNTKANIRFTYQCDDTHHITLLAYSRFGLFHTDIKATVENPMNMQARIRKKSLNSSFNGETEIDWDLETTY